MTHPAPHYGGVIPPVVTPLHSDGSVDTASLERVVERLLDAGVHGVFALGSSGETVYLTDQQRDHTLEVITKTVSRQVPVLAGCIEPTTPRVIERARVATALGVDALVTTAPFYTLVGPHEVERHFRAIHAATDLPQVAYDIPVCVHHKLSVDLQLDLAADKVIVGVKDSSGDDIAFRQLLLALAEEPSLSDFAALTGHEIVVDAMMLAGASGAVPGLANVDPQGYVRLHAACEAGDWATATAEQVRLARLFRIVTAADPATAHGSTRGVGSFKTALAELGVIESNAVSLPMRSLDDEERTLVRSYLQQAGLL